MQKRILIVDDDPDVLKLVSFRLNQAGYETVTASNGTEGLQKIASAKPDLIVLDVIMPGMDGYTFMKEVKSSGTSRGIPIIMLTAKDKLKEIFEMEGVKEYIVKPFETGELLDKIGKCLA